MVIVIRPAVATFAAESRSAAAYGEALDDARAICCDVHAGVFSKSNCWRAVDNYAATELGVIRNKQLLSSLLRLLTLFVPP